ncbi:MAG: lipid II flippase Amj family protein [Candidatus Eremiobacteraeota bacterium]|nr:lipid II flippase Amj family protein [Candidatus Eremiobacteraeota bacterium]
MPLHLDYLFDDPRLMVVCLLNVFINLLTLTTNAARVSGAVTKRVATALSLFNVFQVSFRLLNMIYAPLMASIVDKLAGQRNPAVLVFKFVFWEFTYFDAQATTQANLDIILIKLRFIVFSAALGSAIGFLLLPTFIEIYKDGIKAMERHGSIPNVVFAFMTRLSYWKALMKCIRKPSLLGVNPLNIKVIPKTFLVFNMIGVSIWTIGVIASIYASVLSPDMVRTSIHLSGIINGIGTVCLFVLVEPVSSLLVDQVASGKRPVAHVKIMVIWLAVGSIVGNLLGVVLLAPASAYILWMSKLIGQFF